MSWWGGTKPTWDDLIPNDSSNTISRHIMSHGLHGSRLLEGVWRGTLHQGGPVAGFRAHNQFPRFPTPEWLMKLGIEQMEWSEASPGARGGQGWRLTPAAVVALQIADAKAAAKEESLQTLLNAVTPRLGKCNISDGKLKCRSSRRFRYRDLSSVADAETPPPASTTPTPCTSGLPTAHCGYQLIPYQPDGRPGGR